MIRIITDSAADFEPQDLRALGVECANMTVTFKNETYKENVNLSKEEFFEMLEQSSLLPMTSQPNVDDFISLFESAAKSGDEVIAILISSKLSGTVQSAATAASLCKNCSCHIIDSTTATAGERILVEYAANLRDKGKSAKEIVEAVELIKPKVKVFACVDTLKHLHKGGRISGTAAAIGSFGHIKPIISISEDGSIEVVGKALGRHHAPAHIIKKLAANEPDLNFPIYVMYSHNRKAGEALADKLSAAGHKIDDTHIVNIGAAIGTHIGTNACAVAYVSKKCN
jgi:DegV family protein with EDD domain